LGKFDYLVKISEFHSRPFEDKFSTHFPAVTYSGGGEQSNMENEQENT
jgi:hypothetical protein